MFKLQFITRLISLTLLFLIGINAIVAGFLFIVDPSGSKMGLSIDYLAHSPFQSYLIPGTILFIFIGVLGIVAGILTLRRVKGYAYLVLGLGIVLTGWILVQVVLVRDINLLHVIMFLCGLALIICGLRLKKDTKPSGKC